MINYAIAGLQMGLGFLNQQAESSEAQRQARFAQRQQDFQRNQQNLQIRAANQRAQEIYGKRLELHSKQLDFNREAAQRGYISEQARLNEAFQQSAFQSSAQRSQLMRAMGANVAAGEGRGRSFERASMLGTLGTFGRMQAEKAAQLSSMRGQSARNMEGISRQRYAADLASYQNVMVKPMMQQEIAAGPRIPMPSGNNLLGIANTALGAFQTGYGLTAPGESFFGFKKPA
jgi:hypothetical protein